MYNLKYIAFDADNNELIVLHNHFFSFFTPDGEFKRRDKIPLNSYSFAITPNGYLFHSAKGLNNKHINSDVEYLILMTDKRYKLLSVGFPCTYAQNNNFEGLTRYLDISKDRINFTFKFTNGVYQYVDDYNVNLKYTLNLGSKGIPDRLFQENYSTLMDGLRSNDYYFYMGTCVENEAHSFFRLLNLFTKQYSFIYRDKKTGNCEGGTSWILDKSLHPQLNPPISSYGKYFVSYFLPTDAQLLTSKVLPEEMVTKIKSLNEDDNPVLVFYELKDF